MDLFNAGSNIYSGTGYMNCIWKRRDSRSNELQKIAIDDRLCQPQKHKPTG